MSENKEKPAKKTSTERAKTTSSRPRTRKTAKEKKELAPKKLELLVTVVNRNKTEFYVDLISQYEVNMQMILSARGTAGSDILAMLGIVNSAKSVILSVVKQSVLPDVLRSIEEKFTTVNDGKGVAFTVPMSSIIGVAIYKFLTNTRK